MVKKLIKHKGGLALEIDKSVADALGINQKTDLEMIVVGDMLIVKPKKKSRTTEKSKDKLRDVTNRLMDKYEPVLKKLAKT
jgi:antitoxin component of MazEF toxin-antitoxin module